MEKLNYIIDENNVGLRIDIFLSYNSTLSRSKIQKLIADGHVLVNGEKTRANYRLELNDEINLEYIIEVPMDIHPVKMDLDIIYEDDDLIVINKPKGLVVHPGSGNFDNTLVHGLLYHCNSLSNSDDPTRPGIVHRIDKDTSGLLVCAKNDYAHAFLSEQLKDKTCFRKYYAIVNGVIEHDEGEINAPIGRDHNNRQNMTVTSLNSKNAITLFKVLKRFDDSTLLDVELLTGRTHQIRVHMKYINHPVLNDAKYSRKVLDDSGQYLHAYYLSFVHPKTLERMSFSTDMPAYMIEYINMKEGK